MNQTDSIDLSDLGQEFNLNLFDEHQEAERDLVRRATAHKTRTRHHARRAKAEAHLRDILPRRILPGECWHILSQGDIDSLSYLQHVLADTDLDHVTRSTWCMSLADVQQIGSWLSEGRIKRLDAYVGEIFPGQYADAHTALCAIVRQCTGRVAVFRNHSKIFLCRSGELCWVIESSANINTNPRAENTVITADAGLYAHHLEFFNGIRSFNRDFDDWKP